MHELESLKAGDPVFVHSRYSSRISKLERKTNTSFFVNGKRYGKDGHLHGSRNAFFYEYLAPASPDVIEAFEQRQNRKKLCEELRTLEVNKNVDNTRLAEIITELRGKQE